MLRLPRGSTLAPHAHGAPDGASDRPRMGRRVRVGGALDTRERDVNVGAAASVAAGTVAHMLAGPRDDTAAAAARTREHVLAVVRCWVAAFNRRDAEALVRLAHPAVVVYPSALFRRRDRYGGHDGLRTWIAELVAGDTPGSVVITDVRQESTGEILLMGEIAVQGRPVSPVAGLFETRDGLVLSARSYLSDERTMRDVGHIDR